MTQDEIIEMARQAGMEVHNSKGQIRIGSAVFTGDDTTKQVVTFAKLVAAKEQKKWEDQTALEIHEAVLEEREACADLIHELAFSPAMFATMDEWRGYKNGVSAYLDAIRARGEA